jgi:hypothetical protein
MIGNLNLLTNSFNASQCSSVTIANGSKVEITKIGTTNMLSNTISNVFYLPTFIANLLSIKSDYEGPLL